MSRANTISYLGERVKCKFCGTQDNMRFDSQTNKYLLKKHACFSCGFWIQQAEVGGGYVTPSWIHYRIGYESETFKGFGGRKFTLIMSDGTTKTTTNLWYQGEIPAHFRQLFKVNVQEIKEV